MYIYIYIYQKRKFKGENTLLQWSLQNILENQTFQRRAPFIMVNSYEMAFMNSASHCLFVERYKQN